MLDDTLHEQLAGWVRPLIDLPVPDVRVLRRRARRRVMRRAAVAAAMIAVVAAATVGVTANLPSGRPAEGPAGGPPEGGVSSWPAAPGTWNRGAWQPAGPLPAADAGPTVAPYILVPRDHEVIQVRRVLKSAKTIATVHSPAGQYLYGVQSAGDDRTFVLWAVIGQPQTPTAIAFDELRLNANGQPGPLRLLFTIPAQDVEPGVGDFVISQDASMLAYPISFGGIETISLATGRGRAWPQVDSGAVDPPSLSWAGDRTLAFEWDAINNRPPPGLGLRVLDVAAPGNLVQASRLVVPYSRYCAAYLCRDDPVVTPDGSAVIVPNSVCVRACGVYEVNPHGVFTNSVAEYSTRTGQMIAYVAPPVTSSFPGTLCEPVWTDPSGVQVVTSCGHPEWYDRGHVSRIPVYLPMYGTELMTFTW
jgi:hypothetical protein